MGGWVTGAGSRCGWEHARGAQKGWGGQTDGAGSGGVQEMRPGAGRRGGTRAVTGTGVNGRGKEKRRGIEGESGEANTEATRGREDLSGGIASKHPRAPGKRHIERRRRAVRTKAKECRETEKVVTL